MGVETQLPEPQTVAAPRGRTLGATAVLVGGDVLSFLLFSSAGRASHAEASGLGAIAQVATTALPFALGWFAVAPWLGAFRRATSERPLRMLARTEVAWLAAWPVALGARWALAPDHQVPLSFAIVVLLVNAAFLGAWRTAYAVVAQRLRRARPVRP